MSCVRRTEDAAKPARLSVELRQIGIKTDGIAYNAAIPTGGKCEQTEIVITPLPDMAKNHVNLCCNDATTRVGKKKDAVKLERLGVELRHMDIKADATAYNAAIQARGKCRQPEEVMTLPGRQRQTFVGTLLEGGCMLPIYNTQLLSILHLVLCPRGGMQLYFSRKL